jgi:hypothetical protein
MSKQKWELRKIKKVVATSDFELICTFDNDVIKQYDFAPMFKKTGVMVDPLRKISYFKRVFLEMGVPTWPNGFDVCADLIYMEGKAVAKKKKSAA